MICFFSKFDIIINCTTLGSKTHEYLLPISLNGIENIKENAIIFDIIYDPSPSNFLKYVNKRKIKVLDGKKMNLLQASLAYDYCINENFRKFNTYETMEKIFKTLN